MRHVSKELRIHRVLSKLVAALSIHHVTHESAAIDAKVDFVEVEAQVVVQVVARLVHAAIVEEELPQRRANQLRVKLIAAPTVVESVAAELTVLGYELFPLAVLEARFVARPRPDW